MEHSWLAAALCGPRGSRPGPRWARIRPGFSAPSARDGGPASAPPRADGPISCRVSSARDSVACHNPPSALSSPVPYFTKEALPMAGGSPLEGGVSRNFPGAGSGNRPPSGIPKDRISPLGGPHRPPDPDPLLRPLPSVIINLYNVITYRTNALWMCGSPLCPSLAPRSSQITSPIGPINQSTCSGRGRRRWKTHRSEG